MFKKTAQFVRDGFPNGDDDDDIDKKPVNMRRREELDFGDDAGDHEEENGEGRGDGECGKEEIGDTVSTKSWWARQGLGKLWRKLKTDAEMRLGQTRDAGCGDGDGDGDGGDKKSVDRE